MTQIQVSVDDNFETPDTSTMLLCNLYLQERGTGLYNRKKAKFLKLSLSPRHNKDDTPSKNIFRSVSRGVLFCTSYPQYVLPVEVIMKFCL